MEPNIGLEPKPKIPETKERLSLRVLLADDDDDLRDLFQMVLEGEGHKVKAVQDGKLLLDELLKNGNYDLVVSDNTMPNKKGVEVLREIRSIEKFKTIPFVVATTDNTPDGSLERDIVGLKGLYLKKPVTVEQLSNAVQKVMKEKI